MKKMVMVSVWIRSIRYVVFAMLTPDSDGKFRLGDEELCQMFPEFARLSRGETFSVGI